MATKKTKEPHVPIAQVREENVKLKEENQKIKEGGYCYMCDKHKSRANFYTSTDPRVKSGLTPICKQCAYDLAMRKDANGEYHECTKESLQLALKYLNKPFLSTVYNASIQEASNKTLGKTKDSVYSSYVKNIAMPQYYGLTYEDSDMFKQHIIYEDEKTPESIMAGHEDQDTYTDFIKNKKDVVRLLSYDPFEKESISDQPFLYSQLLGLLDGGGDDNDDMIRIASSIAIVRGFLQHSKIDDTITTLMADITQLQQNSATIKSLEDSKSKITGGIKELAAESCISLKNTKSAKKGENSWTGKLKKAKSINLRESEVNGFDAMTCKGMQQVIEMSDQSIFNQLKLDESEWSDMVAEQRVMIRKFQNDANKYEEISRILLRENIDLKDFIKQNGIDITSELVDLDDLYNSFGDLESEVQDGSTDAAEVESESSSDD